MDDLDKYIEESSPFKVAAVVLRISMRSDQI
jgi:hypothetical protein